MQSLNLIYCNSKNNWILTNWEYDMYDVIGDIKYRRSWKQQHQGQNEKQRIKDPQEHERPQMMKTATEINEKLQDSRLKSKRVDVENKELH